MPQIVSTNRHVSQGGVDILNMRWDESTLTLSGISSIVKGDEYKLYIYVPEGFSVLDGGLESAGERLFCSSIVPENTGSHNWSYKFDRVR